jgi:hypothetical protein
MVEKELQEHPVFTGFSGTEVWAAVTLPSGFEEIEHDFKVKDLHFIFKTISNVIEIVGGENEDKNLAESLTDVSHMVTEKDRGSK